MKFGKSLQLALIGIASLACVGTANATVTQVSGMTVQVGVAGSTVDTNLFSLAPGVYNATLSQIVGGLTESFSSIAFEVLSVPFSPPIVGPSGLGTLTFTVGHAPTVANPFNTDVVVSATPQAGKIGLYEIVISQVPEPGIWLMMAGGMVLLGWLRVRKTQDL